MRTGRRLKPRRPEGKLWDQVLAGIVLATEGQWRLVTVKHVLVRTHLIQWLAAKTEGLCGWAARHGLDRLTGCCEVVAWDTAGRISGSTHFIRTLREISREVGVARQHVNPIWNGDTRNWETSSLGTCGDADPSDSLLWMIHLGADYHVERLPIDPESIPRRHIREISGEDFVTIQAAPDGSICGRHHATRA